MANYVFGIDFGTSHIGGALAKVDSNGKPSGFVVFTNEQSLTYICPAGDLSSPEVQEFLPHSKSCRTVFRAGDEIGCEFIIGSNARDKYQFFLNDNENHSLQNYNKFESHTVPASAKTILVNHLGIDRIYNGEKPYEEFYNQNEYEIEPSEFFTTMFFRNFFLDARNVAGIKACYADVEQVDFVIGTPPGCGEKYAVELIKCVKNGFYLAIKANDSKRAKTLRMRGRTSPEPLLAGYAWFSAVESVKGVLDEGETAFIVDIGAGTTDWTFVTRRQNKIIPLLCDDNGKPIESMGTNFGTSGNAFDKAIKTDLDVFFRLKGLENAIILEQMARGIKEKLYDPEYPNHYYTAQIYKKDPSKPIIAVADGETRRITSFTFNVFKRPELMIVGEDGEDRYITFEEYRDLETLAKTEARFKGFLSPNGAMLERPEYYYEPSENPELDLFFVDLISDEGDQLNNLEKKFDNIANKTLNYFNHYRFNKTPRILFVGNSSNLKALKEHITTKLELGLETSFIHPDISELGERINTMLSLKGRYKINFSNAIAIGACLSIDKAAEISTETVSTGLSSSPISVDANLSEAIRAALEEFGVLSEKSFVTTSKFPHLINSFGGVNCSGSQVEIAEPSENALVARVESSMVDAVSEAFEKLDLTRVTNEISSLQSKLDAISTNAKSASTEAVATGDKISALASEITALAKLVKELKSTSAGYTGLTSNDRGIIENATETVITRANSNQTNTIVSRVTDSVRSIVTSLPASSGGTVSSLLSGFMSFNWVIAIISIVLGAVSGLGLIFGIISMIFPIIQGLIASSSRAGKGVKIFLHILNLLFLLSTFVLSVGLYGSLTY